MTGNANEQRKRLNEQQAQVLARHGLVFITSMATAKTREKGDRSVSGPLCVIGTLRVLPEVAQSTHQVLKTAEGAT